MSSQASPIASQDSTIPSPAGALSSTAQEPLKAECDNQATSSTGTSVSFDQFHLFPKLPLELRLIIWKLAMEPRRVHLDQTTCEILKYERKSGIEKSGVHAIVPVLLHVNQESRAIALKRYVDIRIWEMPSARYPLRSGANTKHFGQFMDLERDIAVVDVTNLAYKTTRTGKDLAMWMRYSRKMLDGIKNLEIQGTDLHFCLYGNQTQKEDIRKAAMTFRGLESVDSEVFCGPKKITLYSQGIKQNFRDLFTGIIKKPKITAHGSF